MEVNSAISDALIKTKKQKNKNRPYSDIHSTAGSLKKKKESQKHNHLMHFIKEAFHLQSSCTFSLSVHPPAPAEKQVEDVHR